MIVRSWPAGRFRFVLSLLAAGVLAGYLASGPLRAPGAFARTNAIDFLAVYCGAEVAAAGADPYRVEPLRTCEHRVAPPEDPADRWSVVPAPLPSYTLWLLRPLTGLPFERAKVVWILAGIACAFGAAWCVARVGALPLLPVVLACAPALGLLNLYYGEPIPLALAAIGAAAVCAHADRARLAGVWAALALLEPHVGLGACVGAFVALPRARRSIVATALLLGLAGIATLGLERNIEYLRTVLPAQARSEVAVNYQLSLTHALVMAGAPVRPALLLGSLSYALLLCCGAYAAWRLSRAGRSAMAIYLPVTFTMLGGTYMHAPEVAAAIPGVLLLAAQSTAWPGVLAALSLGLLIPPWNAGHGTIVDVPVSLAAVAVACALVREGRRAPLASALLLTFALGAYVALIPPGKRVSHPVAARPAAIRPDTLASTDWRMLVSSRGWMLDEDVRHVMLKVPQWLGLSLALVAAGWELAPRRRSAIAIDAERA